MEATKQTAWEVVDDERCDFVDIVDAYGTEVARISRPARHARLIAAAPALLEALGELLLVGETNVDAAHKLHDVFPKRFAKARAAIAKATS